MAELGTGVNSAAIFARGGKRKLLDVEQPSELGWGRVLDAYSDGYAVVNIAKADDPARARECLRGLGDVHTWAHELVMFRDDERVWEGPVRRVAYGRSSARVDARDLLGWLPRRPISRKRKTTVANEVTAEGLLILQRAFADDDPNVLAHVAVFADPGENTITRDVAAWSGYAYDDLGSLVEQGLHFTTVGRRIVLMAHEARIGRVATIVPERDMVTDIEVAEEGDDLATLTTAVNNDGRAETVASTDTATNAQGEHTGVSDFYGLHGSIVGASDVKHRPVLRRIARRRQARSYPAPIHVTIPSGATLNCDAPVLLEQLVPGVVVPIESEATARSVSATMILADVQVKATGKVGEQVTVTLLPPGDLTGVTA